MHARLARRLALNLLQNCWYSEDPLFRSQLMRRLKRAYLTSAVPLLASGVACLVIGMAADATTFLWMAPGFIAPATILILQGLRRRAS